MLGTFALSSGYYDAYYKKALQVRTLIIKELARIFETCPVILRRLRRPTAISSAKRPITHGNVSGGHLHGPRQYRGRARAVHALRAGYKRPAVGMQLIAPAFGERTLYRAGCAFEKEVS
jgi:aspartyl-tRNA(Asn)/glutamyl-tRNA(Gln) amidotransferase subunit A